jgi:hypothetical protein
MVHGGVEQVMTRVAQDCHILKNKIRWDGNGGDIGDVKVIL